MVTVVLHTSVFIVHHSYFKHVVLTVLHLDIIPHPPPPCSCKHFNIDPTAQGQYSIGTLVFPAIMDIVHHYQHNSLFIHEGQHVTLSSPARRRTRGTADTRAHS